MAGGHPIRHRPDCNAHHRIHDNHVTSAAWQGFDNAQTLIGGIDPKDYRVVIVKSSTHFRAYFTLIADKVFTADGPEGTTTIVTNFKPVHLRGPVYPFDLGTKYP